MDYADMDLLGSTSTVRPPVYKWGIVVGGDRGIVVRISDKPYPNWFQRLMYKALLGWEIRRMEVNDGK